MSISLQKGQKVNLSKDNAGLSKVVIGLGWDEVERKRGFFAPKPQEIDCDASALLLSGGKVTRKEDLVTFATIPAQYSIWGITLQAPGKGTTSKS